jgi:hypothetical protein
MAFLKALSPSAWLFVVLAALAIGAVWKFNSDSKEITGLQKDVVVKEVQVQRQDDTIQVAVALEKVKEDVGTAVAADIKVTTKKESQIIARQDKRERAIEQVYNVLPPTVDNTIAKAEELSQSRITSAWDVYCVGNPDATECKPEPVKGASHA